MKHSKFYGFIPLGIALIVIVLLELGTYESPLTNLYTYIPYGFVMLFCIIGGAAFLLVGVLSVGRHYLKHNDLFPLFSILTVILIPLLVIRLMNYESSLTPIYAKFSMRSHALAIEINAKFTWITSTRHNGILENRRLHESSGEISCLILKVNDKFALFGSRNR